MYWTCLLTPGDAACPVRQACSHRGLSLHFHSSWRLVVERSMPVRGSWAVLPGSEQPQGCGGHHLAPRPRAEACRSSPLTHQSAPCTGLPSRTLGMEQRGRQCPGLCTEDRTGSVLPGPRKGRNGLAEGREATLLFLAAGGIANPRQAGMAWARLGALVPAQLPPPVLWSWSWRSVCSRAVAEECLSPGDYLLLRLT